MKYSDDSDEHRTANIKYAQERWRQLYALQIEWGTEGIKYLLFVNAGAAAAMLAFLGSVENARDMVWPKVMLGLFSIGVILVGALHAVRRQRVHKVFKNWRNAVNEYYTDQKTWREIIDADAIASNKFDWEGLIALLSFVCLIIGVIVGTFNLSTLTNGDKNGRQETIESVTQTQQETSRQKGQLDNKRLISSGEGNKSNAEQPAPSTRPKEEVTAAGQKATTNNN